MNLSILVFVWCLFHIYPVYLCLLFVCCAVSVMAIKIKTEILIIIIII